MRTETDVVAAGINSEVIERLVERLTQLDGRTVGLLGYSSNTKWDGSKRIVIAEDRSSRWHIDLHVDVGDMAYLTFWKRGKKIAEQLILNCDDAPEYALHILSKVRDELRKRKKR